jgi:hypothetical protein
MISISSGEVLLNVAVSKTIYSTQHNVSVLRFVDQGTRSLELESGAALNEPTTYAVRVAIEQAVYEMIVEGEKKGLWRYKQLTNNVGPVATVTTIAKTIIAEPVAEVNPPVVVKESVTTMKLREASYIYKSPDEKSQRTWMLKENTELTVTPGSDSWVAVQDRAGRRGWVKSDRLMKP